MNAVILLFCCIAITCSSGSVIKYIHPGGIFINSALIPPPLRIVYFKNQEDNSKNEEIWTNNNEDWNKENHNNWFTESPKDKIKAEEHEDWNKEDTKYNNMEEHQITKRQANGPEGRWDKENERWIPNEELDRDGNQRQFNYEPGSDPISFSSWPY